jgi:hypothetical protein
MKKPLIFSLSLLFSLSMYGQLMVTKLVGKNSSNSKLGFGLFAYYDFTLPGAENRSVRLELMDFGYFPSKTDTIRVPIGYISIKLGYKYIFSETKTGFYVEPQAGYCRVVSNDPENLSTQASYGDGVAFALEVGYSLEVGQRGHTFDFGLKYEDDIAGSGNTMSSVGFRVSYAFNMFKRRDSY